jgi:hypothetical protein
MTTEVAHRTVETDDAAKAVRAQLYGEVNAAMIDFLRGLPSERAA